MLFNLIMQIGEIPDVLEAANATPLFKKGCPSDDSNYRPISIICVHSKLFESCTKSSLVPFMHESNLITSSQHGFLSSRSTCTNLLESLMIGLKVLIQSAELTLHILTLLNVMIAFKFLRLYSDCLILVLMESFCHVYFIFL